MHFPGPGPIGHGIGLFFGAIVWTIGSLITLAIVIAVILLLVRYLWFATKASQRYLELNGQPTPRPRPAPEAPAASSDTTVAPVSGTTTTVAPAASPDTTVAPASAAPKASTTSATKATSATKPAKPAGAATAKPRTPPTPKP